MDLTFTTTNHLNLFNILRCRSSIIINWGVDNRNKANYQIHDFEKNQKKDFDPKKLKSGVLQIYTPKILF